MEKKPEWLEELRKGWEEDEKRRAKMTPEELAEEDRKIEAMMNWLFPEGHVWHTAEADGEEE